MLFDVRLLAANDAASEWLDGLLRKRSLGRPKSCEQYDYGTKKSGCETHDCTTPHLLTLRQRLRWHISKLFAIASNDGPRAHELDNANFKAGP